jgi:NADH:ubiquinone oxidoreductase subunit 6 (subunit J)
MGKVARWIVTVIVGAIAATVAFLVILRMAEPTGARWGLAPAGAAVVLGLAWAIGSSWVNHAGRTRPTQHVENSEITAEGDGWAVGNARDIRSGSQPPAKRRGRGGSTRR